MDIATLRLLLDVAREPSFAAAARRHEHDPSSVSRTIAQLERELGFRLFQRTTRVICLTEAGERYLRRVEAVVQELDAAAADSVESNTKPTGTLRLTASVAFGQHCLVPLLPKLRKQYPDLKLDLILTDSNLDLVAERIDLGIRLGPKLSGDLVGSKLMDTRYRVCAAPQYLKTVRPFRTLADIARVSCLLSTLPQFRSHWLFQAPERLVQKISVHGDVSISSPLALREAALLGLGPAMLADWLIARDVKAGRLVDLFPSHRVTATTFETAAFLVYPNRAFLPSKVRVVIDFLRKYLAPTITAP